MLFRPVGAIICFAFGRRHSGGIISLTSSVMRGGTRPLQQWHPLVASFLLLADIDINATGIRRDPTPGDKLIGIGRCIHSPIAVALTKNLDVVHAAIRPDPKYSGLLRAGRVRLRNQNTDDSKP